MTKSSTHCFRIYPTKSIYSGFERRDGTFKINQQSMSYNNKSLTVGTPLPKKFFLRQYKRAKFGFKFLYDNCILTDVFTIEKFTRFLTNALARKKN